MLLEQLEQTGKQKLIDRRMAVNCHICGASMPCPPDADFWEWLKKGDVQVFYEEHRAHGNGRSVGAQITEVEKE